MLIRVQLTNFRNFEELEFFPFPGFTLISGPNGSGKSNLLESIHYLGMGCSFRHVPDDNLVRWGSDFFLIKGEISQGSGRSVSHTVECAYRTATRRKIFKINGKRELPGKGAGYLPVVVFSPQDLLLIQGQPVLRRRFIDSLASQIWPHHADDLNYYRNALSQRNSLLRQGSWLSGQMDAWDEQLVTAGSRIIRRRLSVLSRIFEKCRKAFEMLGGSGVLSIAYVSSAVSSPGVPFQLEENCCHKLFQTALSKARILDQRLRFTTVGPHRDDIRFLLNGHDARLYSSQGEQRLIALSLKIGQSRLLAEEQQLEPLVLLDDVFSELDGRRRRLVLDEFCSFKQVIATATDYSSEYAEKRKVTDNIFSIFVQNL